MADAKPHKPLPPQTGADYNVERPSFARRFTERVGGGVLSGIMAGAIRVGFMGLVIGTGAALIGGVVSGLAFTYVMANFAIPLMIGGAIGGALFVGGANLITGLFGAAKDAIFNPNRDTQITQTPEQAKGAGQDISPEKPTQNTPGLVDDAITQADPNKPAARHYGPENAQENYQQTNRPATHTGNNPADQAAWENRNRIGFKQSGAEHGDVQQPSTNANGRPHQRPIGFGNQSENTQADHGHAEPSHASAESPGNHWVNKTAGGHAARGDSTWVDHTARTAPEAVDGHTR